MTNDRLWEEVNFVWRLCVPSYPSQQDFVKDSRLTDGRGFTNELHSFDLEEGGCDVLPLTVYSCCAYSIQQCYTAGKECVNGVFVCVSPLPQGHGPLHTMR